MEKDDRGSFDTTRQLDLVAQKYAYYLPPCLEWENKIPDIGARSLQQNLKRKVCDIQLRPHAGCQSRSGAFDKYILPLVEIGL